MINYWLERIDNLSKENRTELEKIMISKYGRVLNWEKIIELDKKEQISLLVKLEEKIKKKESPIDSKKLAIAIQKSRSGIGGAALTSFTCKFCEKEEMWSNTAVPSICTKCAKDMADAIILNKYDIFKENKN